MQYYQYDNFDVTTVRMFCRYMNTLSDDDAHLLTYDYFRDVLATPAFDRPWASANIYYRCNLI